MQGKLENASSWVGRPSPVLGLVAHYNHTSHRERMPVLGLAAPSPVLGLVAHYNHTSHAVRMPVLGLAAPSPVLGLVAHMPTVPTRRVVWAGLVAPKLTTRRAQYMRDED